MTWLVFVFVAPLFAVTAFFSLEVAAGLSAHRERKTADLPVNARLTIIIPANNEQVIIGATLERLTAAADGIAQILVVADNCIDETARVAAGFAVTVVERNDPGQRGKGFALAHARDVLRVAPPQAVCILDADCRIDRASLAALFGHAIASDRAGQAINLLEPRLDADSLVQLSSFAFVLKNLVRARGLERLAGAVHLTGTGMALPWAVFDRVELATASVVEDLRLGIDLALVGEGAELVPGARVWSPPASRSGTLQQRTRWETGFIATAAQVAPDALRHAIGQRNRRLLAVGLDLAVPPLALLTIVNVLVAATLALAAQEEWISSWLLEVHAAILTAFVVAVAAAWWQEGRDFARPLALALVPFYILWKLPIYAGRLLGRGPVGWLRTGR